MSDEMKRTESQTDLPDPEIPSQDNLQGDSQHSGHHSDSHHGGHHHHHHHHRKRSLRYRLKRFVSRYRKMLVIVAAVLCVAVMAVAMLVDNILPGRAPAGTPGGITDGETEPQADIYIGSSIPEGEICLVGEAVKEFMASDISVHAGDVYAKYKGIEEHMDAGVPLRLSFTVSDLPTELRVDEAKLEIAESTDPSGAVFYEMDENYTASVYNLKTGTTYAYRAVFRLSNGAVVTRGGELTTAATPRLMTVDGIRNVRDIGGWRTTGGKAIRQGLLYRGTELDSAVEDHYLITQDGINELLLGLGVKTDMDLRAPTDRMPGRYVLGTNVNHRYYDAAMYDSIFTDDGKAVLREIFRDLADPAAYPVYLHCTYGCDRTGTTCYVLEALLGLTENDLIRDYELSAFFEPHIDRAAIRTVYDGLQSYPGFTLQEKTESYLLSIGVTAQEIAEIKRIFLY